MNLCSVRYCLVFAAVVSVGIVGCGPKEIDNSTVSAYADQQVRAIDLRKERFELADKIRFTQDTLLSLSDSTTPQYVVLSEKLRNFDLQKKEILATSLRLADTLRQHLDSLFKVEYPSKEDRELFNNALTAELSRRGYKPSQTDESQAEKK